MSLHLVLNGEQEGAGAALTKLELTPAGLIIGRSPDAGWPLPDPSRRLSSRHCEIEFRDGSYWLRDVSKNGTYLNGARDRLHEPHRLSGGDAFEIGPYRVTVEEENQQTILELPQRAVPPFPPKSGTVMESGITRAAKPKRRKLAAILAADIVGFSRMTRENEDRTLENIRALRTDVIVPKVAKHEGRIVKFLGDGFLAEFSSVVDGVRCAMDLQRTMATRNASLDSERRIVFRIGVHIGDIVEEADGDIMGDGVNIAARLEGVARPGGIMMSEDAYRFVKTRLNIEAKDLGPTKLKNIDEPIRAFAIDIEGAAGERPASGTAPQAPAARLGFGVVGWTAVAVAIVIVAALVWRLAFSH